MKRFAIIALVVACVFGLTCRPGFAADEPVGRPHIVVIMVDDLGYGDPGCYNEHSKVLTPSIDALARDGMRFTDAHAPGPLCHMSRYGLLTGRYPFRTNVSVWPRQPLIEDGQTTIASLLRSSGYHTAMVGKWHLGFREDGYDQPLPGGPVDRGFDSYFGIRASTDIPPYFYIRGDRAVVPPTDRIEDNATVGWSPIQGAFWRAGGIAPNLDLEDVTPRFTDEAIRIIEDHAPRKDDSPLMLYLAYPSPHTPWLPTKSFVGRSGAGMYGDFTMMVDTLIGRVLGALDEAGMADNTLVIFTSDNGPVWYDSDVERFGHDSCGPWRGMKGDAWEAGHRMPFIVRWPDHVAAGSASGQTICFTDLLATFADLIEKPLGPDDGPDSFSFLPTLLGSQAENRPVRRSLVLNAGDGTLILRRGPWKLIQGLGSRGFSQPRRIEPGPDDPPGQLYHLENDPGETTNLYADHPDVVASLEEELAEVKASGRHRP